MKKYVMERRQLELCKDFIKLWNKYEFDNKNLDHYDLILMTILKRYKDITKYREKRKYKIND